MKIKTTIYTHKSDLDKLEYASKVTKYSKSFISSFLLHKLKKNNLKFYPRISVPTEYQLPGAKNSWHKLHVDFHPADYENFIDMRNFFRRSLSLLLAIAIKKYLMEMLDRFLLNPEFSWDKFWSDNYTLNLKIDEANRVIWQVFWDFPREDEIFK